MPKILPLDLPHGRKWVVDRGCECGACERRRFEDDVATKAKERDITAQAVAEGRTQAGLRRAAPAWKYKVRFTKPGGGEPWRVVGPPDQMRVGMLNVLNAQNRSRQVYVHRLGKVFDDDGVPQQIGYIRR